MYELVSFVNFWGYSSVGKFESQNNFVSSFSPLVLVQLKSDFDIRGHSYAHTALRNCATYSTEIIKTCPDLTNRLMLMSSRILLNWSLKLHNSNRRPLSSFMHAHWCRRLNYFSRPEVTQCCWQDIVIQQLTDLFQSSSSNPMLLTGRCNLATNWPISFVLRWPNAVDRTL